MGGRGSTPPGTALIIYNDKMFPLILYHDNDMNSETNVSCSSVTGRQPDILVTTSNRNVMMRNGTYHQSIIFTELNAQFMQWFVKQATMYHQGYLVTYTKVAVFQKKKIFKSNRMKWARKDENDPINN